MKTCALVQSSPLLTGNVKMILAEEGASLRPLPAGKEMSSISDMPIYLSDKWPVSISKFFSPARPDAVRETPLEDWTVGVKDYSEQYGNLYRYGCQLSKDGKIECFAPLRFGSDGAPYGFAVFKNEGNGAGQASFDEKASTWTCVHWRQLKGKPWGEWLENNFGNGEQVPPHPMYIDYRNSELSYLYGADIETGAWSSYPFALGAYPQQDTPFKVFDERIAQAWKKSGLLHPKIANLCFEFTDVSAKDWTLNRYTGLYLKHKGNSTNYYIAPDLGKTKTGCTITNNLLTAPDGSNPFIAGSDDGWVWANGKIWRTEKTAGSGYKISSNILLDGFSDTLNNGLSNLSADGTLDAIVPDWATNGSFLMLFIDEHPFVARIDENGKVKISTGGSFSTDSEKLAFVDEKGNTKTWALRNEFGEPLALSLMEMEPVPMRDMDMRTVETGFAEKDRASDPTSLYCPDWDNGQPADLFIVDGSLRAVPATSELSASGELFEKTTDIWSKYIKLPSWGLVGSLGTGDYPYRANLSLVAEDHNRNPNPYATSPVVEERNLDSLLHLSVRSIEDKSYIKKTNISICTGSTANGSRLFLNCEGHIGLFKKGDLAVFGTYSARVSEISQEGLLVDADYADIGATTVENATSVVFPLSKYLTGELAQTDYFGDKTAYFCHQQDGLASAAYFRGIATKTDRQVDLGGWSFVALVSKNDVCYDEAVDGFVSNTNAMVWQTVEKWSNGATYGLGDITVHDEVLWRATSGTTSLAIGAVTPATTGEWSVLTEPLPLWSPAANGESPLAPFNNMSHIQAPPLVWREGNWWYSTGSGGINFWYSGGSWAIGEKVFRNGKVWLKTGTGQTPPSENDQNWERVEDESPIWTPVAPYDAAFDYPSVSGWSNMFPQGGHYVWHEGSVWWAKNSDFVGGIASSATSPGVPGSPWKLAFGLAQRPNYEYGTGMAGGGMVLTNGKYRICRENPLDDRLDNGLAIFIDQAAKSVLFNIYHNDSLLSTVKLSDNGTDYDKIHEIYPDDRSELYSGGYDSHVLESLLGYLESGNGDFSNPLRYFVKYSGQDKWTHYEAGKNGDLSGVPFLLAPVWPDMSELSNILGPVPIGGGNIQAKRALSNYKINDSSQANWYAIGKTPNCEIAPTPVFGAVSTVYRYSGFYDAVTVPIVFWENGKWATDKPMFGKSKSILSVVGNDTLKTGTVVMLDDIGVFEREIDITLGSLEDGLFVQRTPVAPIQEDNEAVNDQIFDA